MPNTDVTTILARAKRKLVLTDVSTRLGVEVNDQLVGHVERVGSHWHAIRLDGARISPSRKFTDRKAAALALAYNHCFLNLV